MALVRSGKRVVVSVDMESKNSYKFGNGQILQMFPDTNNFDRRQTQPVNGIVIDAEDIPLGAEVLLEHNSTHAVSQVFDYDDSNPHIKYFSVPEMEVYVWRKEDEAMSWQPTRFYEIAERVYKPYVGIMVGIEPERIKNTLLIKTGEFKGKIVHTVKNGEYEIIYQDSNGKPNAVLVVFNVKDADDILNPILSAKQEITAVDMTLTKKYLNGDLFTGLDPSKSKPIM